MFAESIDPDLLRKFAPIGFVAGIAMLSIGTFLFGAKHDEKSIRNKHLLQLDGFVFVILAPAAFYWPGFWLLFVAAGLLLVVTPSVSYFMAKTEVAHRRGRVSTEKE